MILIETEIQGGTHVAQASSSVSVLETHLYQCTSWHCCERLFSDADPGPQDLLLWLQYTNTQGLQKSCGEKGAAWPLSKLERGQEG